MPRLMSVTAQVYATNGQARLPSTPAAAQPPDRCQDQQDGIEPMSRPVIHISRFARTSCLIEVFKICAGLSPNDRIDPRGMGQSIKNGAHCARNIKSRTVLAERRPVVTKVHMHIESEAQYPG